MEKDIVYNKVKDFALRIIKLCRFLNNERKEFVISNQIIRSGTSIGANLAESLYAASKADFANKLQIALKEASETKYWIELLYSSQLILEKEYNSLDFDITEIIKLLTASLNTSKI